MFCSMNYTRSPRVIRSALWHATTIGMPRLLFNTPSGRGTWSCRLCMFCMKRSSIESSLSESLSSSSAPFCIFLGYFISSSTISAPSWLNVFICLANLFFNISLYSSGSSFIKLWTTSVSMLVHLVRDSIISHGWSKSSTIKAVVYSSCSGFITTFSRSAFSAS